jgi:hypothetical protein
MTKLLVSSLCGDLAEGPTQELCLQPIVVVEPPAPGDSKLVQNYQKKNKFVLSLMQKNIL